MRKIATLDFETDPFLFGRYPKPFAADIFDGDEHFTFWGDDCAEQAILFLFEKDWLVYAHNGGKFDYHFFLEYLQPWDEITIISGRLAKFKIGNCEFRDSINILPIGLGTYNKIEIDYKKFESEVREQNKEEIITYLHGDTEYLYDLVSAFIDNYGLHLTQASAAINYWKRFYLPESKKKDWLQDGGRDYYELLSPFYYGGRVECFKKGLVDSEFEAYDIHSAYPFAMLHDHPIGLSYFEMSPDVSDLYSIAKDSPHGFFDVVAISNGALPFRDNNKLFFPDDNQPRRYRVTGWEIIAAVETNSVEFITAARCIIHSEVLNFRGYVEFFYNLREVAKKSGDKKMDIFAKIFMNSLYGKWGANPTNYKSFRVADYEAMLEQQRYDYEFAGTLGPNLLMARDLSDEESRFYNVATAASITGFVRAYLWRHIKNSDGVIYCDTDCIFAKKVRAEVGSKLGQWGHEGDFVRGAFAGKKLYAAELSPETLDKKTGAPIGAGVYKKASKGARLSAEDVFKVASGETVIYRQDAPSYSVHNLPSFVERKIRMV